MRKFFIVISLLVMMSIEVGAQTRMFEYQDPKVTVILPPVGMGNGKAIVACPGGGYVKLAKDHEGLQWAPYFNNLGYAYAVVEYQLPNGDLTRPMADVEKTFELLTANASQWGIDPTQIGIMGSSAGGHLASAVATHPTEKCRPAFQILFYPVVSLEKEITHRGTMKGFLGENPSRESIEEWSADMRVSADTPPAILILCSDDDVVKPINSIRYFNALQTNGIPVEMLIYPAGGHGWGYRTSFAQHEMMLLQLTDWLRYYAVNR